VSHLRLGTFSIMHCQQRIVSCLCTWNTTYKKVGADIQYIVVRVLRKPSQPTSTV
jgi:hypothetical protein